MERELAGLCHRCRIRRVRCRARGALLEYQVTASRKPLDARLILIEHRIGFDWRECGRYISQNAASVALSELNARLPLGSRVRVSGAIAKKGSKP